MNLHALTCMCSICIGVPVQTRAPLSGFMYACARRHGCTHAYLSFKPLDLSVLVLQLSAKLIGCYLLRLHDLDQVDILLHQDLTLDDDVRVTKRKERKRTGTGDWRQVGEMYNLTFNRDSCLTIHVTNWDWVWKQTTWHHVYAKTKRVIWGASYFSTEF